MCATFLAWESVARAELREAGSKTSSLFGAVAIWHDRGHQAEGVRASRRLCPHPFPRSVVGITEFSVNKQRGWSRLSARAGGPCTGMVTASSGSRGSCWQRLVTAEVGSPGAGAGAGLPRRGGRGAGRGGALLQRLLAGCGGRRRGFQGGGGTGGRAGRRRLAVSPARSPVGWRGSADRGSPRRGAAAERGGQ